MKIEKQPWIGLLLIAILFCSILFLIPNETKITQEFMTSRIDSIYQIDSVMPDKTLKCHLENGFIFTTKNMNFKVGDSIKICIEKEYQSK